MSVLVLGSSGFIGRNLCKKLILQGHEVYAVMRPHHSDEMIFQETDNLHCVYGDYDDYCWIDKLSDIEYIYILAWPGLSRDNRENEEIHGKWSELLLKCIKKIVDKVGNSIRGIFLSGSQEEYGKKDCFIVTEADESIPITAYGKYKWKFSRDICELCKKRKIRFVEFRLHSIFGLDDKDSKIINQLFFRMMNNESITMKTACEQRYNLLYIDDCIDALYLILLDDKMDGIFNIGTEENYTLREYIDVMKKEVGYQKDIIYGENSGNVMLNSVFDTKKFCNVTGWKQRYYFQDAINKMVRGYLNG